MCYEKNIYRVHSRLFFAFSGQFQRRRSIVPARGDLEVWTSTFFFHQIVSGSMGDEPVSSFGLEPKLSKAAKIRTVLRHEDIFSREWFLFRIFPQTIPALCELFFLQTNERHHFPHYFPFGNVHVSSSKPTKDIIFHIFRLEMLTLLPPNQRKTPFSTFSVWRMYSPKRLMPTEPSITSPPVAVEHRLTQILDPTDKPKFQTMTMRKHVGIVTMSAG